MLTWIIRIYLGLRARLRHWTVTAFSQAAARKFRSCDGPIHLYWPFDIAGHDMIDIGKNVHINSYSYIRASGGLTIGDNVHIGPQLTLYTRNHDFHGDALPYDTKMISKPVVIEKNVWIGARVTIAPGVTIGEGAIIGAGCVVAKDVPPLAIVVGQPFRIVKYRDKDHYDQLESEMQYGGVSGKLVSNNRTDS